MIEAPQPLGASHTIAAYDIEAFDPDRPDGFSRLASLARAAPHLVSLVDTDTVRVSNSPDIRQRFLANSDPDDPDSIHRAGQTFEMMLEEQQRTDSSAFIVMSTTPAYAEMPAGLPPIPPVEMGGGEAYRLFGWAIHGPDAALPDQRIRQRLFLPRLVSETGGGENHKTCTERLVGTLALLVMLDPRDLGALEHQIAQPSLLAAYEHIESGFVSRDQLGQHFYYKTRKSGAEKT